MGKFMKMKKGFCIFFLFLFLLTGCGTREQKLVCTDTETEDGLSIGQTVSMTYQGDQLTHMTIEVLTKLIDDDHKEYWDEFKKSMDQENEEFDQDGVSLKVEKNDQEYEYRTILDIDVQNASDEMLEKYEFEGIKEDPGTIESNKDTFEQDGGHCEIH